MKSHARLISTLFLFTKGLDSPLWAMFNLLPIFLYKELGATTAQLAIAVAMKPSFSMLSLYWSRWVHERPDRLYLNIILAKLLGCALFLLYPFQDRVGFFLLSQAVFMTFLVGVQPAYLELIKRTLSLKKGQKVFAVGSSIGYLGGGLLPIFFGFLIDQNMVNWKLLFSGAALISFLPLFFFRFLPRIPVCNEPHESFTVSEILHPWKSAIRVLQSNREFSLYQVMFTVLASGLMIIQPALPKFFVDKLSLSYTELGIALSFCKGVSYAIASPCFARLLSRIHIFAFTGVVALLATVFPLLLFFAQKEIFLLYVGYAIYGVMQAGSELSWNMSGPIFAGEKDSTPFTSVNILTVGLRGLVIPFIGSFLLYEIGTSALLFTGSFVFLAASALFSLYASRAEKIATV